VAVPRPGPPSPEDGRIAAQPELVFSNVDLGTPSSRMGDPASVGPLVCRWHSTVTPAGVRNGSGFVSAQMFIAYGHLVRK
jgi:hypothetical protein